MFHANSLSEIIVITNNFIIMGFQYYFVEYSLRLEKYWYMFLSIIFHFITRCNDILSENIVPLKDKILSFLWHNKWKNIDKRFLVSQFFLSIQQSKTNRLQGFMIKPFLILAFSHKRELRYIVLHIWYQSTIHHYV